LNSLKTLEHHDIANERHANTNQIVVNRRTFDF
jgi:hypothetical protein